MVTEVHIKSSPKTQNFIARRLSRRRPYEFCQSRYIRRTYGESVVAISAPSRRSIMSICIQQRLYSVCLLFKYHSYFVSLQSSLRCSPDQQPTIQNPNITWKIEFRTRLWLLSHHFYFYSGLRVGIQQNIITACLLFIILFVIVFRTRRISKA
jgi:hypothetical protein